MTVRDLLQRLDSPELTEWMAFLEQESAPPQPELTEEEAWKRAFGITDG